MVIHVVQPGDSLLSIAEFYGVSESSIIRDNGLEASNALVPGQSIIITYPEVTYTVKEGDTLSGIANSFDVTVMQLLMNNPYLSDREYLYPGDTLVIKYTKKGSVTTHGNTVPYINTSILKKTLPYLTYLSILNYTAKTEGEIITYYDDSEIIETAKLYGVIPLMLLTTLTIQGEANLVITYDILLNEDFQNRQIDNILTILKEKGYSGINMSFQHVNISNQQLFENYLNKISTRLKNEGFLVFATINPDIRTIDSSVAFERIDYTVLEETAQNIIFMNYEWATNTNPPSPIISSYNTNLFLEYINNYISMDKVIIGISTLGYDWVLPYSAGLSTVSVLTLDRAVELASNVGATIHFDEQSQSPYFQYSVNYGVIQIDHIVWYVDARSINAILDLISTYGTLGTGIWNITIYNTTLWLTINSQYEIVKNLPTN